MTARLTACLLLFIAGGARAEVSAADLVAAGRLQLRSSLQPSRDIVARQRVILELEVATDRWFAGGTRIRIPEVPGLVILQTEQFASNATERRNGEDWVIQRWSLDLYPRQEGEFRIPPVRLEVKVNHETAGVVTGEVEAPPLTLQAALPPGLAQGAQWVAAPGFSARREFDRELATLEVGAAFEQRVRFEATDLMAMMLPEFSAPEADGLAIYPQPPTLRDSSDRGEIRASREQRISYLAQAPGAYTLPAQDFFWWDTGIAELRVVTLPAVTFEVAAGAAGGEAADRARRVDPLRLAWFAGGGALALLALTLLRRLWPSAWRWLRRATGALRRGVNELRRPALPPRLNPDSSAGE